MRLRIRSNLIFKILSMWFLKCFNSPFDNTLETRCSLWFFNETLVLIRLLGLFNWKSIFIIELILPWCYRILFWTNIIFSLYTFLIASHFFFFIQFFYLRFWILWLKYFPFFLVYPVYDRNVIDVHLFELTWMYFIIFNIAIILLICF